MRTIRTSSGIELTLLSRGQEFLGIGKVRAGSTALRSGKRPVFGTYLIT